MFHYSVHSIEGDQQKKVGKAGEGCVRLKIQV